MNCKKCNDMLSDYIDQEVTPSDKVKIDQHLESCEACKREYEELKAVRDMLKELPMKELPEGFEAELHEKLVQAQQEMKQEPDKSSKVIDLTNHFRRHVKRYSIAVAACLVVAVSYKTLNQNGMQMEMAMEAPAEMAMDEMAYSDSAPMLSVEEADGAAYGSKVEAFKVTIQADDASEELEVEPILAGGIAEELAPGNYVEEPQVAVTTKDVAPQTNRKIIQTGYLSMDIEDYDATLESIMDMTVKMGGYIENMSTSFQYGYRTENPLKMGHITIRVPQVQFQGVMRSLDSYGQITDQNMNSEDITYQYRDIANEVANLEVREAKLREIMDQAEEIKDVLEIERELSRVRGQINDLKGTLIQWDQLVSLSRITINLYEVESLDVHIEPIDNSLGTRIRESFIRSINELRYSLESLTILVVALFPFLVGYSILGYVGYRLIRKIVRAIKNRRK